MMAATFCLRLATGMVVSLLLLKPSQVNPRFFRTHFLTALGLLAGASVLLMDVAGTWLWLALGSGIVLTVLSSIVWALEGAPGGRALIVLTGTALAVALGLAGEASRTSGQRLYLLTDDLASAALLGTVATAMLIGHSYLIAPAMSLTPLFTLLGGLAISTLVRMALAGAGLWQWTAQASAATLDTETMLWLAVRWALGFLLPLVLGWMAWQTARIRSTQSATGILYVVVIVCFLGELTSQLLLEKTGYIL
jgi:hypothetical protein